jgi:hypothetical protein
MFSQYVLTEAAQTENQCVAYPVGIVYENPVLEILLATFALLAAGPALATPPCQCERFAEDLAAAEAVFASRGEGATVPLDAATRTRFRARVDDAYERATCLAACDGVPEKTRNPARVLLASAAFKTAGLPRAIAEERLEAAVDTSARCLAVEPEHLACHLWHASARGIAESDSWNPFNVALPAALLAEFRAARAGAPPGHDLMDGAATRGETALLLKAPSIVGGDPAAARRLIEEAATAPRFACSVANRMLLAEARARTGDVGRAHAELRATVAAGLPSCGSNRYENALTLEEAARCLARLEAEPTADPGWDSDCK